MNKKAQTSLTKTGILFTILVIYALIILFTGWVGYNPATKDLSFTVFSFTNIITAMSGMGIFSIIFDCIIGVLSIILLWIAITTFTPGIAGSD